MGTYKTKMFLYNRGLNQSSEKEDDKLGNTWERINIQNIQRTTKQMTEIKNEL